MTQPHPWVKFEAEQAKLTQELEEAQAKLLLKQAKLKTAYTGLFTFLLGLPCGLLKAYVLTIVWPWFVMPFGVPQVSVLQMYGALIVINLVKGWSSSVRKSASEWTAAEHATHQRKAWDDLFGAYLYFGFGYLFLWALAKYMGLT